MKGVDPDLHRVRPGGRTHLAQVDPDSTPAFEGGKASGLRAIDRLKVRLERLQELLHAAHSRSLLVVLQAMDTGGKDGTIRRVFEGVNPQGVRVASFKVPTPEEADHDFLWRAHRETPGKGGITIFNRSHYEDVLVTRVHGAIAAKVWERRYREIREFERTLTEEGTGVVKFFLHIDPDEQKRRLEERLADPEKHWKFNSFDLRERERWDDYMAAYEEAIARTSTDAAPWYVVPANRKWYRDLIVLATLDSVLGRMKLRYPALPPELKGLRIS